MCNRSFLPPRSINVLSAIAIGLAIVVATTAAFAQEKTDKEGFTVEQALNIASAMSQLGRQVVTDEQGNKIVVGQDYKFSADLRYLIAINGDIGRTITSRFQNAAADIRASFADDKNAIPPEKAAAFNKKIAELMQSPSRAGFNRIKFDDLCMEAKPPKCEVANQIPGPVLSLFIAIVDR